MSIHPIYRLLGNHMKSLYKHSTLQIYWVDSIHKGSQLVCAMQKINKGNHLTTLCLLAWVSVVQMSHLNLKKSLTHRFLLLSQLLIFGNIHTIYIWDTWAKSYHYFANIFTLPTISVFSGKSTVRRPISALCWQMEHDKFVLVS